MTIDQDIAALAARQRGHVTRKQLLEIGIAPGAIEYRVNAGRLHLVHRGVYAVGHRRTHPMDRAAAAVLACGPTACLTHGSAATLWGFLRHWREPFEVSVRIHRRPNGIVIHRRTHDDLRTHHGIRVTSPARTIIDVAPRLNDADLTRLVNDALLSRYLQPDALEEALRRTRHDRRLNEYRGPTIDGPTRSRFEDKFKPWCAAHDLPTPQTNVIVNGREVDAYFPDHNLIVELDSWEFHRSRQAFEKDRDDDGEALADGTPTLRITWDRVHGGSAKEAERLHRTLRSHTR
jgi:hypothetical protein